MITYSCESCKAEVEGIKELPVLTVGEDCRTSRPDDHGEEEDHQNQVNLDRNIKVIIGTIVHIQMITERKRTTRIKSTLKTNH